MRPGILNAVGGAFLAFLLGATTGVVTTFAHRGYPVDVGVTVPLGLLAGLLIVLALVAGFRLVFVSRVPAAAAAIGVAAAIAVLSLPGTGGSILIVDDPAGYVWAIGSILIGAVTVAWPRARRRSAEQPRADERPVPRAGGNGEDRG